MKKHILIAAAAALSATQIAAAQAPDTSQDRHVLKLDDVELNSLIADVSTITGYTFIVHPDVRKARVSVVSQTPMSSAELFQVFLTTLRVQGFAAIPAGRDAYRIVPEAIASTEAPLSGQGANAFLTEIIKLDFANAMDVAADQAGARQSGSDRCQRQHEHAGCRGLCLQPPARAPDD